MSKKTILITGAGSGLGMETALGLAKAGHKIIAGVHTWEQKTDLLKAIEEAGLSKNVNIIKLDILDAMDCQHAWQYDIDILVSNAGIGHGGPVSEMPVELIREVMETNVFSTLEFAQPFIYKMVKRKKGKVIFTSSIAGLTVSPFLGAYHASKHALESIVQSLREELVPFGVTVATINPGPYRTGFNDRMLETYEQWYDEDAHFTPRKKIESAKKQMAENQFDPQEMIDKMVELIPMDEHPFRNILPVGFNEKCQQYQQKQYKLKNNETIN